jgi:hypothetical protein
MFRLGFLSVVLVMTSAACLHQADIPAACQAGDASAIGGDILAVEQIPGNAHIVYSGAALVNTSCGTSEDAETYRIVLADQPCASDLEEAMVLADKTVSSLEADLPLYVAPLGETLLYISVYSSAGTCTYESFQFPVETDPVPPVKPATPLIDAVDSQPDFASLN